MPSSSAVRAGRAFVEISGDDRKFRQTLERVSRKLRSIGSVIRRVGTIATAAGAAIAAPFAGALKVYQSFGDQLDKISARTGFTVETLSALGFAADRSGASLEDLEKGIRTLQVSIRNGTRGLSTYTDAFNELGLNADQLSTLSPEKQFEAVAEAISKINDPSRRAALAMQLLGRAGTKLIPLLSGGAAGLEAFRAEAEELGIIIDTETAAAAAQFTDALGDLKTQIRAVAVAIGAALGPALTDTIRAINPIVRNVIQWVKENKRLVAIGAALGVVLLTLGVSLITLGAAIGIVAFAIGGLSTAITVLGAVASAIGSVLAAILSPVGLVIIAVAALGAAVIHYSGIGARALDWLGSRFAALRDAAAPVIQAITDSLRAGNIEGAARVLWAGVLVAWENGKQAVLKSTLELGVGIALILKQALNQAANLFDQAAIAIVGAWLGVIDRITGTSIAGAVTAAANAGALGRANQRAQELERLEKALSALLGASDQAGESAIDAAKRQLEQAIADARAANEELKQTSSENAAGFDFSGITSAARRVFSSSGAFNALGGSAFASGSPAERTANAAESIKDSTKRIERSVTSSQGAFFV